MSSNGVIFAALLYYAICIVALLVVPLNRKPSSAIAWLMLIVALPYLGVILFLLLGSPKLTKRRRARQRTVDQMIKRSVAEAKQQPGLLPIFAATITDSYRYLVELNANLGGMPAFAGNSVESCPTMTVRSNGSWRRSRVPRSMSTSSTSCSPTTRPAPKSSMR
jgi:hypothetical protein